MNKVAKKLWLKDLRDTECPWKQGIGALMGAEDRACCLGVATDIAVRLGIVPEWEQRGLYWGVNGECSILPHKVAKWLELDDFNPMVFYTAPDGAVLRFSISMLNDGGVFNHTNGTNYVVPQHTFAQIADIIEEQL